MVVHAEFGVHRGVGGVTAAMLEPLHSLDLPITLQHCPAVVQAVIRGRTTSTDHSLTPENEFRERALTQLSAHNGDTEALEQPRRLVLIWYSGAPAADGAGVPRLRALAGQGEGLDVLVEAGGAGQAHHGEAVERRAVRTVVDDIRYGYVLLRALICAQVMLTKRGHGASGYRGT